MTFLPLRVTAVLAMLMAAPGSHAAGAQASNGGTIKGHIRLPVSGPAMWFSEWRGSECRGSTPQAGRAGDGVANLNGDLANVFVKLVGTFPGTAAPRAPVIIDQSGCIYTPRVVGLQAGQTLQIRNSDSLLHNLRSSSSVEANNFNVGQPLKGMVTEFRLKTEQSMMRLGCDIHAWMTAYIGIVDHPYFAVSNPLGTFEIVSAPAGTYSITAWHERYGTLTQAVRVRAGAATVVDFTYTGNEQPTAKVR